jgi:hypothetical protein
VPALAKQIARIYERDVKNRLYAGYASAGQAFVHKDDMINAFCRVMGHDYRAEISRPHRCMDRGAV